MPKILFVCHGNICRSPMSQIMFKDLVRKEGLEDAFEIASAATTTDEIWHGRGNPIYPPAREELEKHGIMDPDIQKKRARLMTKADYKYYDLLIGMDTENKYDMLDICGGDPDGKIHLLLDYTDSPRSVADPWYTGDFTATWNDLSEGLPALLSWCRKHWNL